MTEYSLESGDTLADEDTTATGQIEQFDNLRLACIAPSLTNPRKTFDPAKLTELAESIKASGVHQPILVRPLPGSRLQDTERHVTHEIVAGERRYRACKLAGVATIPALIRPLTDHQVLEVQIVENLQRDDLTELEEAEGYQRLMQASNLTAIDVGAKIGKSRSYIFARLKLLDLCIEARDTLRNGTIDASRALLLARIPDHKLQIKALGEITDADYNGDARMSAREAAKHLQRNYMLHLERARFSVADAALLPQAGSCKTCPKRTGFEPELFADVQNADVCTDPPCYHRKEQAHTDAQLAAAHAAGQDVIAGREAKELMPNSWGAVEGYLRLDDQRDSPTDQPLRKLIGKQIEADGIKPTLIENPHQAGELIAVLPSAQVANLLKAKGHADAADRVDAKLQSGAKAEAAAAKTKLQEQYEQGWRAALLERTWAKIKGAGCSEGPGPEVIRHIALHYAHQCNTDRAKRLCKLLDLGKVAPVQGLQDYVRDCSNPQDVLQLLVMAADVEYKAWLPDQQQANAGLLLVASDYLVNVDKVQADIKAQMRSETKTPNTFYRGVNGETWSGRGVKPKWVLFHLENGGTLEQLKFPKAPVPLAPAAQATGGRGAKAQKTKTTAAQAQAQIAAAMQAQEESSSGADAQGLDAASGCALSVGAGFVVGQRVRITTVDERLSNTTRKWAGKEGTVTKTNVDHDPDLVDVTFKGRSGGVAMFRTDQLEAVAMEGGAA